MNGKAKLTLTPPLCSKNGINNRVNNIAMMTFIVILFKKSAFPHFIHNVPELISKIMIAVAPQKSMPNTAVGV